MPVALSSSPRYTYEPAWLLQGLARGWPAVAARPKCHAPSALFAKAIGLCRMPIALPLPHCNNKMNPLSPPALLARPLRLTACALLSALVLPIMPAAMAQEIRGKARVIDGDSLDIRGRKIQLSGIDAMESRQRCWDVDQRPWRCGEQATRALKGHINGRTVRCRQQDVDRYGRIVATCFVGRQDLSEWMVLHGWAVAYRRYSDHYVQDELRARMNRAGIWGGSFEEPEDWRRSRRR